MLSDCGATNDVRKYKLTGGYSQGCKSCMCKIAKNKLLTPPTGFGKYSDTIYVSITGEVFSTKSGILSLSGRGGTDGCYKRVKVEGIFEYVHRLVALTFIPLEDGRDWVNHKDTDTLNNHVGNLEWVTPRENKLHQLGVYNYKS